MTSPLQSTPIAVLAFGAHPDDIEFGCGGVVARETQAGRRAHFVVCSRGEAASNGLPGQRVDETQNAAALLGATVEFLDLGGDAHFEVRVEHVLQLARVIRRIAPRVVLAPTPCENQHPDHARLGAMVRDAVRLARYGGLKELLDLSPHSIGQLLFFAVTPSAEPKDGARILVDVSGPRVFEAWRAAMDAHATQQQTRDYTELQVTRARLHGMLAGATYAIPLWPNDDLVFDSLEPLCRAARRF